MFDASFNSVQENERFDKLRREVSLVLFFDGCIKYYYFFFTTVHVISHNESDFYRWVYDDKQGILRSSLEDTVALSVTHCSIFFNTHIDRLSYYELSFISIILH